MDSSSLRICTRTSDGCSNRIRTASSHAARSPAVLPLSARRRMNTGASTCAMERRAEGCRSSGSRWNRGNGGTGEADLGERGEYFFEDDFVEGSEIAENGLQRVDLGGGLV